MLNKLKGKKGFTLIEVVIVLAIGALVILVVLQAVGAAQRSQRDNERKQEAARISALLEQYASNNGGCYPEGTTRGCSEGTFADFLTAYDSTLDGKGWVDVTTCADPQSTTSREVVYAHDDSRDYDLAVCLEAGGESLVSGDGS